MPRQRMIRRMIRIIGLVIFVIAFFLPAIQPSDSQGGPGSGSQVGWVCAGFALAPSAILLHPAQLLHGAANKDVTLLFSGWVNPLLLIYLLFSIWRRFVWTRRVLAVAILACLASTWIFFVEVKFIPLIGHYLWVLGILAILAPEVLYGPAAKAKTDSDEQNT
jgi:hypothetical protein